MRPDIGTRIALRLPTEFFSQEFGGEKIQNTDQRVDRGGQEDGFSCYSLSMCVRFLELDACVPLFSLNDCLMVIVWENGPMSLKNNAESEENDDRFFSTSSGNSNDDAEPPRNPRGRMECNHFHCKHFVTNTRNISRWHFDDNIFRSRRADPTQCHRVCMSRSKHTETADQLTFICVCRLSVCVSGSR